MHDRALVLKQLRYTKIISDLIIQQFYTGCPINQRNGGFTVHCELKDVNIFTSTYKVFSAEENDT